MEKKKALELFIQKEVRKASTAFVTGAMSYLKKENKEEAEEKFREDFLTLFGACRKKKEEPSFVQASLVRGRALQGEPFYLLEAYGPRFYLEEPMASLEMNLWWLYEEYGKFCEAIDRESKRYIGSLQGPELSRIKLIELINAEKIVRYLYENMLVYLLHAESGGQIQVKEGFRFQLGEYQGPYEMLLEVNEATRKLGRLWHGIL